MRVATLPFRVTWAGLRSRRLWKSVLVIVLVASVLGTTRSNRVLSPAELAARGYEYNLAGWELSNFFDKWIQRVRDLIPGIGSSEADRRQALARYLDLNKQIDELTGRLNGASASADPVAPEISGLTQRLDELQSERRGLRDDVEELLESAIDDVLDDLDLGQLGPLTWPPVDFRLDMTPRVLVTSPRDRILRQESLLLDPHITVAEREKIEAELYEGSDLSAIVLGTGGVATFPTVVPQDRDLLATLDVAAHEWLHAYLIFRPLGRAYWDSSDLTTLNETVANLFGEEVGRAAYERLTGESLPPPEPFVPDVPAPVDGDPEAFNFRSFMRETRLRADELLAQGDIEGAEAYMERRRVELQDHGIFIRKINQAYFAFQGSYGDNPASVSPIGTQVQEFRSYVENAGDLVKEVQGASSYEDFLEQLERARNGRSPGGGEAGP